ncbi:MAG: NAD(P)H-hydrate epimerase [Alkalispirochaeta sp.]
MKEFVTADEMAEMDRLAIDEYGPTLLQMMENAGRNLAELVMERAAPTDLIIVAAGIGGNGGGGICAARHLANHGRTVRLTLSRSNELREAAQWQRHVYAATGSPEIAPDDAFADRTVNQVAGAGGSVVIIDALLGYNATGAAREPEASIIRAIHACAERRRTQKRPTTIVSLDLPSGMDATTGERPGAVVAADIVLTLALPKTGLKHVAADDRAPQVVVADIGIPRQVYEALNTERPFHGRYREKLNLDTAETYNER